MARLRPARLGDVVALGKAEAPVIRRRVLAVARWRGARGTIAAFEGRTRRDRALVVTAEGQASRSEGDDLRTFWFTSVGAIAHVQHFGGSLIVRRVRRPDEPGPGLMSATDAIAFACSPLV